MKVTSYDYYTYTHSIDVTIYSLGLAKTLLFTRDELEELGCSCSILFKNTKIELMRIIFQLYQYYPFQMLLIFQHLVKILYT